MIKQFIKTLKTSEEFMYMGLLEMSAWMGIPEHKRHSMIKEIFSNYQYFVNEKIKELKMAKRQPTKTKKSGNGSKRE